MPFWRHRRLAWVALIAFAAQLVLSFGHVHTYRHPLPANFGLSAAAGDHEAPGQPEDSNRSCALCWLAHAAGVLVLPEPARQPVRVTLWEPRLPTPGLPIPCSDRSFAFQARAPPPANL